MPSIYLSPAMQDYSPSADAHHGNTHYADQLLAEIEPYLRLCGITFSRGTSDPIDCSAKIIDFDAHISICTDAALPSSSDQHSQIKIDYDADSMRSERIAQYIAAGLKSIHPDPAKVQISASASMRTCIPAVSVTFGCCNDAAGDTWIHRNTARIAQMIVLALTDYFHMPFISSSPAQTATVEVSEGTLNIRSAPSLSASIIGSAPDGAQLSVYGQYNGWYAVQYLDDMGYVSSDYIVLNYK